MSYLQRGDFNLGNKRYNIQPSENDRANERSSDLICPTGSGNDMDDDDDDDDDGDNDGDSEDDDHDDDDTYIIFEETPIDEDLMPDNGTSKCILYY